MEISLAVGHLSFNKFIYIKTREMSSKIIHLHLLHLNMYKVDF